MTTNLKAKLLQHFVSKKANGGFTLIELLVVIIIIGILSAIALPSFLNQGNRARQSEAQTYIGSMNRAQQVFYMENAAFTDTFDDLGIGIPDTTDSYEYGITLGAPADTDATGQIATNEAASTQEALQTFFGAVGLIDVNGGITSSAVMCETDSVGVVASGTYTLDAVACPTDTTRVGS